MKLPTLAPLRTLTTILFAASCLLFVGCSDNDDNEETTADDLIEQIGNALSTGSWRITLYNDSGVDETSDYTNYTFTFEANGSLVANNGTETFTGLWYMTKDDDSSDDNSIDDNEIDFNIAFSGPEVLLEITDDWDVSTWTETRLELYDISGGDGSTDLLTFEKN